MYTSREEKYVRDKERYGKEKNKLDFEPEAMDGDFVVAVGVGAEVGVFPCKQKEILLVTNKTKVSPRFTCSRRGNCTDLVVEKVGDIQHSGHGVDTEAVGQAEPGGRVGAVG